MTEERRLRPIGSAPAFPTGSDRSMDSRHWGLSKREHLAGLILAGLHARSGMTSYEESEDMVVTAVNQAEALLEHLHKSDREVV